MPAADELNATHLLDTPRYPPLDPTDLCPRALPDLLVIEQQIHPQPLKAVARDRIGAAAEAARLREGGRNERRRQAPLERLPCDGKACAGSKAEP